MNFPFSTYSLVRSDRSISRYLSVALVGIVWLGAIDAAAQPRPDASSVQSATPSPSPVVSPAKAPTSSSQDAGRTMDAEPSPQASASVDAGNAASTGSAERASAHRGVSAGLGPAPDTVVRDSPRQSLAGFYEAYRARDFDTAAHYLRLSSISSGVRKVEGPILARKLGEVLDAKVWLDVETVSDDPNGGSDRTDAPPDVQIGTVPVPGGSQGIRLSRMKDSSTGKDIWVFSASTVRSIERLYELYGPPDILEELPLWMRGRPVFGMALWQWIGIAVLGIGAFLGGSIGGSLGLWPLRKASARTATKMDNAVVDILARPLRLILTFVVALAFLTWLRLPALVDMTLERLCSVGIIYAVVRASLGLVDYGSEALQHRGAKGAPDDLKVRASATRLTMLRRVASVVVVLLGIAAALMQFPTARALGLSLLGSAGVAGAILGFAAQKTFANLFAGMVISVTQPIRIGDIVVLEGEWGTIEDIGSTHVIVRIWDLRRLIVPVSYFLEKHFENWTRKPTELIGVVTIHADYRVKLNDIKAELDRILDGEPLWNGTVKGAVVLALEAQTALFRVTVSADDAGKLFDLRCNVRARMLSFLQARHERMPVRRLELHSVGAENPVEG